MTDEVTLLELSDIGFRLMDYPKDLWPPMTGIHLYVCVAAQERTRTDQVKTVLVPIMKAGMAGEDREVLKQRVAYHANNRTPRPYGKS